MRDIGKNIKSLRIQKKLTQDELAQLLFVTRQTVSNYETGNSHPDVDMLLRIAEVFQVDVNRVIYGKPIPEEQKKKYWSIGVSIGITVLTGILLVFASITGDHFANMYAATYYFYCPSFLLVTANWMEPAWLLLAGWTLMHVLCVSCGTRPLRPPVSRYVKWGILSFVLAYGILILPHTVWFVWVDLQRLYRHTNGIMGEFSSSFSVFPAWDWLVMHIFDFVRPRNAVHTVFYILDYLPLPLGALLRLCRQPGKRQKAEKQTEE